MTKLRKQSILRFVIGLAIILCLDTIVLLKTSVAGWEPLKPVEFVVMADEGGGADRLADMIQSIIEKEHLLPQPIKILNLGAGSGAEALRYLHDSAGDPHVIAITLNSLFTTPLRNPGLGVDIAEFTPIARLAEDTFLLWVNSDSDVQSVDDYVAAVKKAGPDNWKMGGTGSGQEDFLVTTLLEKAFGIEQTYVPFKGGGTVAKNLVGGHVNSTVNNPSEQLGFFHAGKSRPLAAFTPERLEAFPDVPTFRELGYDLVYSMQRSIIAPAGIPYVAQDFYVGVFRRISESDEWNGYIEKKGLSNSWLTSDELMKYFISEREMHRELLKGAGEIK